MKINEKAKALLNGDVIDITILSEMYIQRINANINSAGPIIEVMAYLSEQIPLDHMSRKLYIIEVNDEKS